MKQKTIKSTIEQVLDEAGPTRSFRKAVESYQKELLKLQQLQDEQKKLAKEFVGESDSDKKAKLKPALIAHHKKVKTQQEKVDKANYEYELAMHKEPVELDEVTVSESVFTRMTED